MGDRHQISIHALREEGDQKGHTERRRQGISIHALREEGDLLLLCSVYFFKISIHALREEGDLREPPPQTAPSQFLSTPSARRATAVHGPEDLVDTISIHALREEGDLVAFCTVVVVRGFLSTPSARRATRAFHSTVPGLRYFYPRPPRGGRQSCPHSRLQRLGISIHALREEGDLHPGDVDWPPVISIHALREEGDISSSAVFSAMGVFLSTPSARRATPEWRGMLRSGCNFYPRPPRGGRRRGVWLFSTCPHISIHALREEGDVCAIYDISELISFLSTPSARRATCCGPRGGDSGCYFYPRPPRGGRQPPQRPSATRSKFLSTPSARRATAKTETKSLFSNKLYNILHEFRRALIYNGSKNYPNHAK